MICGLCGGLGNHFVLQRDAEDVRVRHREWWGCQACGGAGVRVQHGPAFFPMTQSGGQRKTIARAERKAA